MSIISKWVMGDWFLIPGTVVNALLKEQWLITHDPLEIQLEKTKLKIDLGAERLI
ncbi:MAG: element excision factor XisH family protein [Sphaerospermopsis kisseleviana]